MRQISPILHGSFRKMHHVNLDYFRIHSKIAKVVHRGRSNFLKSTCDIGDPLSRAPSVFVYSVDSQPCCPLLLPWPYITPHYTQHTYGLSIHTPTSLKHDVYHKMTSQ